jgi:hypothetical protein
MTPGRCKGNAHKIEHLGIAGRRVLVSRKWSNKTLDDHRADRAEFVRQLLEAVGIQPSHGPQDGPYRWERTAPADPDVPPRPVLLLHAVAERHRWKAEYTAAQLATNGPPPTQSYSVTGDQAAWAQRRTAMDNGTALWDLDVLPEDPASFDNFLRADIYTVRRKLTTEIHDAAVTADSLVTALIKQATGVAEVTVTTITTAGGPRPWARTLQAPPAAPTYTRQKSPTC